MSHTLHASAVLWQGCGILVRGPSGSGKSRLSARLIDEGGRLVADDRVFASAVGGRLVVTVPAAIAGLIELRGRGPVRVPYERAAVVRLVADIVGEDALERLPAPAELEAAMLGVVLARQPVPPDPGHAVSLIRRAVTAIRAKPIEPCARSQDRQDAGRF